MYNQTQTFASFLTLPCGCLPLVAAVVRPELPPDAVSLPGTRPGLLQRHRSQRPLGPELRRRRRRRRRRLYRNPESKQNFVNLFMFKQGILILLLGDWIGCHKGNGG